MHYASRELSEELCKLSGWKDTDYGWLAYSNWATHELTYETSKRDKRRWVAGVYGLGYLLRKLPRRIDHPRKEDSCCLIVEAWISDPNKWWAGYSFWETPQRAMSLGYKADTPEDAACKLAVELFKQGVLKKEES